MTVELFDKVMERTHFTKYQRKAVMTYLRKKYYAKQIDQFMYQSVRDHVVNHTK